MVGFLRTCIDKRFVAQTREEFERETGLAPQEYWHEAYAGGSSIAPQDTLGEDYAFSHGATIFGWQAHGDTCAEQPTADNATIEKQLREHIKEKQLKFPSAKHYFIFATEAGVTIQEVTK